MMSRARGTPSTLSGQTRRVGEKIGQIDGVIGSDPIRQGGTACPLGHRICPPDCLTHREDPGQMSVAYTGGVTDRLNKLFPAFL
jgi:hypothetical protein